MRECRRESDCSAIDRSAAGSLPIKNSPAGNGYTDPARGPEATTIWVHFAPSLGGEIVSASDFLRPHALSELPTAHFVLPHALSELPTARFVLPHALSELPTPHFVLPHRRFYDQGMAFYDRGMDLALRINGFVRS